jgi:hypothetical protein
MLAKTVAPDLYDAMSGVVGRFTLRTMSAIAASAREPIRAPAASKSPSGIPEAAPAPASTTMEKPIADSRFTVSGDAATLSSPAPSRPTKITLAKPSPPRSLPYAGMKAMPAPPIVAEGCQRSR